MKLLMDADCLIKLTQAGLKEFIVTHCKVFIPLVVKWETVGAGLVKKMPDALVIEENIRKKKIMMARSKKNYSNGDVALQKTFDIKKYEAVATDDKKLTRFLRTQNIPYVLPAVLIYKLFRTSRIEKSRCHRYLDQLSPYISREEYSTVKILMEK